MAVKCDILSVYQYIQDLSMPFQKNHKLGFTSDEPLDRLPICFKGRVGQKERLKTVLNWQEQLRDFIDTLIEQKPS